MKLFKCIQACNEEENHCILLYFAAVCWPLFRQILKILFQTIQSFGVTKKHSICMYYKNSCCTQYYIQSQTTYLQIQI